MTTASNKPRRAILVTGAASGTGAATACRFIKEGWQVAITYAASKDALNILSLALAHVLAAAVRMNAVCPVLVEQGFVERLAPQSFAERKARQIGVSPLWRSGHPDEVAETIHWLITSASMMTEAIVELDFGMHLNAV
jgi:NAD(P)-dependent dehydrogenase (short-subunit alcohol dehydrogenase family)